MLFFSAAKYAIRVGKIHITYPKESLMNKSELINAITALEAVLKAVENALIAGDSVTLVGFGTFGVKDRAERTGRNPQTGKEITIAAAKVPFFKPGKSLKDVVNS
jgi:DNA-binding protein HU-beta